LSELPRCTVLAILMHLKCIPVAVRRAPCTSPPKPEFLKLRMLLPLFRYVLGLWANENGRNMLLNT